MFIGIALWPLAVSVSISTYRLHRYSHDMALESGLAVWAIPIGFLLWIIIFFLLPRPFRTYVLGHELTHALWAILMGGRVGRIKVGKKGGHVELSKSNFIITLAPYFFPFYTALVVAAYSLAGNWLDTDTYFSWWLAAVGFTWSFHLTFTIHMLAEHQPDIEEHGRIFSFTVIYIMNLMVIALLMILFGEPELLTFGDLLGHETASAYSYAALYLEQVWTFLKQTSNGFR